MPVEEEVREEEGERNGVGSSPEGEYTHWVLSLEAFISLLQAGILGRSWGRVSAEYSSVFQVWSFRVMVSTDWSEPGQEVISHYSWCWCSPPGFAAFLGLELNTTEA